MESQSGKHPNYILIWVVLAVLTVLEVLVAMMSGLNRNVLVLVLLAMAIWKAVLVAMYFMHLKFEPKRLLMIAVAPLPLAVIIVIVVMREFR